MTKTEVIASVAGDLKATEKAVDEAIARATTLVQAMIGGRIALGVSPIVGADAQAKAMETITNLSAARQAIVACHNELAKEHRRMGYGVYADFEDKRPEGIVEGITSEKRLRAV